MQCQTFWYINAAGEKVYKPKKVYDNQDLAITAAKRLNLSDNIITKAVAYHCKDCHKYHVGRNGKTLTEKYINRIKQNSY